MRGGVPDVNGKKKFTLKLSPHAWGCTVASGRAVLYDTIVPTCVGVYRRFILSFWNLKYCPHMRGGVPVVSAEILNYEKLSPHAWGCTVMKINRRHSKEIVPTCVGVYRHNSLVIPLAVYCPHMRGGVPMY